MKKMIYSCDCCDKEVKNEDELYTHTELNTMSYLHDGTIELNHYDLCIDCLYLVSGSVHNARMQLKP